MPQFRAGVCAVDQCFTVRAERQRPDRSVMTGGGKWGADRLLGRDIPQLRRAVVPAGRKRRAVRAERQHVDRVMVPGTHQESTELLMTG